jgi:hypothetical protein
LFDRKLTQGRSVVLRGIFAVGVLAIGEIALAQYPPPPPYGYGYGGYGGGTVASNNMNGMANMMSAKGSYNLQTSQAAINTQQAESEYIQNRQAATNAYFDMRATNRAATAAERGPRPTTQQLAQMAAQGVPKPISPGDMDPVSGQLNWPDLLQDDQFKSERDDVEQLVAKQSANGRLGYSDKVQFEKTVNEMFQKLKAEITAVPSQQYVASRSFLQSLMYSTTQTELQ